MSRLWCELAWLDGDAAAHGPGSAPGGPAPAGSASAGSAPAAGVVLDIEDDRIVRVETDVTVAPAGAERLPGLTLPGLANAHSHAFHRALRGRTQSGRGSFWTWREQMYELAGRLDPDSCFAISRACFGEMALAGITCVGEFHYVHHAPGGVPYSDPNALGEAVLEAAAEVGLRITLLDACYLHGGIDRFRDRDVHVWAERVGGLRERPAARVGAAIHSVRAVDPEAACVVAEWAATRPLHAHVSEQPRENEECLAAHGLTPAGVLAEAGALSERFTAVHATHLTEHDIAVLGDARACVCLCPTTERDLADGIGPARALSEAGSSLAVGSDSQAVIDLFEEARAIELDERLASGVRGQHEAVDLLLAATSSGHAALGWPEAGRLAPGALADLCTVSLEGVRLAGTPAAGAVESVVFAGGAGDVRDVMVGGRWIVRGGAHVSLDVAAELRAALS